MHCGSELKIKLCLLLDTLWKVINSIDFFFRTHFLPVHREVGKSGGNMGPRQIREMQAGGLMPKPKAESWGAATRIFSILHCILFGWTRRCLASEKVGKAEGKGPKEQGTSRFFTLNTNIERLHYSPLLQDPLPTLKCHAWKRCKSATGTKRNGQNEQSTTKMASSGNKNNKKAGMREPAKR